MSTAFLTEADSAASALAAGGWSRQLPAGGSSGDGCGSGLNGFAAELMQFLRPLEQLYEQVVGDPAGLYQASHAWESYAGDVQSISDLLQRAHTQLDGKVQGMTGETTLLSLRIFIDATHSIADWCKVQSQALQLCVRAVEVMRSLVCAAFELLSTIGGSIRDVIFDGWPWELEKKAQVIQDFAENCAQVIAEVTANIDRALQALREMVRLMTDLYRAIVPFHQALENALGSLLNQYPPGEGLDALAEQVSKLLPEEMGETYNPDSRPYDGSEHIFESTYDLGYSHEYDLGFTDMTTEELNKMLQGEFGHIFLPSRVGDNSQLNTRLTGKGQVIDTSLFGLGVPEVTSGAIVVQQVTDDGFVIAAEEGHPEYPGEVAFRLRNVDGRGVLEVTGAYDETILSRMGFSGDTNPEYAGISDVSIWSDMQYRLEDMMRYGR